MQPKYLGLDDRSANYVLNASLREIPVLRDLRQEMASHESGGMQIAADQGQFMALLAKAIGAKKVLEVGVFTGYSSTVVALALPEDGKVTACDLSEEFTRRAQKTWADAGVADKVELLLGPGIDTLDRLIAEGKSYDLAFIDADKPSYPRYYEQCLTLLRPGGLLLIDNMLWGGKVADPEHQDHETVMFRDLTLKLRDDDRIDFSLLTVGDGVGMCRVRER